MKSHLCHDSEYPDCHQIELFCNRSEYQEVKDWLNDSLLGDFVIHDFEWENWEDLQGCVLYLKSKDALMLYKLTFGYSEIGKDVY